MANLLSRSKSRSAISEETMNIASLNRSSFDLSHNMSMTAKLGRLQVANIEPTMPGDVVSGSINPNFTLELAAGMSVGQIRLDTHHYFVSRNRINRDFRQIYASGSHNATTALQHFTLEQVIGSYLSCLCAGPDKTTFTPSDTMKTLLAIPSGTTLSVMVILDKIIANLRAFSGDSSYRYHYNQDFFSVEATRLQALRDSYALIKQQNGYVSSYDMVMQILEPLFGTGSTADMIGAPILNRYGVRWSAVQEAESGTAAETQQFTLIYNTPLNVLASILLGTSSHVSTTATVETPTVLSYEPWLAAYAAWYDLQRDWHLEPSTNILNPDTFDNNFSVLSRVGTTLNYRTQDTLANIVQIFGTKYRYWSRDALTTVQPDDIYRHVYSPIVDDIVEMTYDNSVSVSAYDSVNKAISLLVENSNIPFLGDRSFFSHGDTDSRDAFMMDLQTLRRTGMLEKVLAKNWYHPDTYAGQIRAKYQVDIADDGVLVTKRLGGDESFISGDQLKASMTTDATPAGTRTFYGGASHSSSFGLSTVEFGYVISFVSLMPIRKYDAFNSHLLETTLPDLPIPDYAVDARKEISSGELVRNFKRSRVLGYVPYKVNWRVRLDDAHGRYLTDYRHFDFLGDYYNLRQVNVLHDGTDEMILDPYQMRVHPNMSGFVNLQEWDDVAYGSCDVKCFINRALPQAVEFM